MRKLLFILAMAAFAINVKAQFTQQIDSVNLVGITTDSLEFVVYSTINGGADECTVEYVEENNNIKVNILYTQIAQADCYCSFQKTIKIKKGIYTKAIVEVKACFEQDFWTVGIKELDLSNILNIVDNFCNFNNISIFPNPVKNTFYIDLGENKTVYLGIYNQQGGLLFTKDITTKMEIDISFLSSGLYFVFIDKKFVNYIIKN